MELRSGQRISAPFLPGPAEVKTFAPRSGYYRLEVLLQDGSNRFQAHNIFTDQLAQIQVLDGNPTALTADAEDFSTGSRPTAKARVRSGEVRVSANEWKKARRYGDDYWFYIVTDAGTSTPELHHIRNPEAHFRMDEEIFVTGFRVPEEHWRRQVDGGE